MTTKKGSTQKKWLILAYRVPSEPSRCRVQAWRRIKATGAVYLQSSVALLPAGREYEQRFRKLRHESVQQYGGEAYLFRCEELGPPGAIEDLFNRSRDEEYEEIVHRSREFLDEIAQETAAGHFSFAELEENEEDLQKGLGIPGPEVAAKSKLDPAVFFGMIDRVLKEFPQVKVVATTLREVHSTNRHSWSAVAWIDGTTYSAPTAELDVYDRVGGGDGFASGLFYGLLAGEEPEQAVRLGWAHGALLTTTPGDTTMVTVDQVRAFAKGGSARIQR